MLARRIGCVALIVVALVSIIVIRPIVSSVKTYEKSFQSIDARKQEVMTMSASSAASAALMSVLPEDWANPIAQELAGLSKTLLIVLTVLYAEKYLMPIIGMIATVFLIPLSCGLGIAFISNPRKKRLMQIALKLAFLAVTSMILVPFSIWTSDTIETIYHTSIERVTQKALEGEQALVELKEANEPDSRNIFQKVGDAVSSLWKSVSDATKYLLTQAKESLSYYVEAIAIRIVVDCVIPILVLLGYATLIKYVFGLSFTGDDVRRLVLVGRSRRDVPAKPRRGKKDD